jgi:2-C-methyl-D-erythritol 2,4-cyclodiphosphate synthase
MRIGQGYDVHRFKAGRKLILCGVEIPWESGLDGHSDADVAIHALMDALLGAAAMGDIGKLFPPSDPQYKGISSIELLKRVMLRLKEDGYEIGNIDITIVAEQPKLSPFSLKMRENIADVLGTDLRNVSVKATTEEGLGFTGAKLGIAAHSIALINEKLVN